MMRFCKAIPEHAVLALVTALVACTVITLGVLFPSPTLDTTCRYAMMAEKFAAGEWFEAFHPRFCVFYPVVTGGLVRLTGIDGHTACVVVSMLGWALGIVPLYRLARNVFGVRTAWLALVLYIVCPQTIFWGFQGLRETWRMLATLLAVAALFEPRGTGERAAFVEMLLAEFILLTARVDTVVFALVAYLVYGVYDRCRWRFALLSLWCLVWIQPCCALNWYWTGWWLPGPQMTQVFIRFLGVS